MQCYRLFVAVMMLAIGGAVVAPAQGAMFLKFDGIDGESRDADHRNWSEVESFSLSISFTGGVRPLSVSDILVSKQTDKASPKLFEAIVLQDRIDWAALSITRPRGESRVDSPYATWEFEDVLISSYQTGGSASDPAPTEQISFNFARAAYTYFSYDEFDELEGTISFAFDFDSNTVITETEGTVSNFAFITSSAVVPEPTSGILLSGLAGMLMLRRRRPVACVAA